ncbi:uncharacterized protein [Euwallacea similis]|uniref:uncharacterized protein n=1 Tax=Euwallacea similis TaxID=1736056 RepID=UPI00344FCA61
MLTSEFPFVNIVVLTIVLFGNTVHCIRFRGSSRSGISKTLSHPSLSYHPRPSYHPNLSPSHYSNPIDLSYLKHRVPAPSPAASSRPIGWSVPSAQAPTHASPPSYGFNSGHSASAPSYGFKASAPLADHHTPVGPPTNVKPVGSSNSGAPPAYGWKPSETGSSPAFSAGGSHTNNPPAYGWKPSTAIGPPTNTKPLGNAPPGAPYQIHPPPYTPHNPGVPSSAHSPAYNPAGYGPPPAYSPAYSQHAHPQQNGYGYSGQSYYHAPPGVTNININNINTNTHHYGGGFGGYGGGFSYPSYHYTTSEVGSGHLGFFLGYSLAKLTTPTYHYHSFYDGYTPRYDHYEVHHYYHNRDSIPAQSTIQPNTIVGCIGDSGTICPSGTTSLCTNNGAILCVASASSTVPCSDQTQGNCVRSVVPCVNGTKDCVVGQNTTLTIPCISKAEVPGNITYINNTIIVNQTTIINNNGTQVQNGTVPMGNLTEVAVTALHSLNGNVTSDGTRSKRAAAAQINEFCVTILALPAERKPSDQQQALEKGTSIFSRILVRALGIQ